MSNSKLQVTLLADEWKSSKGGLSTLNRELAIQLARHPNVSVTFLVPEYTEDDKNACSKCSVRIVKAEERYGYDPVDWLSSPPKDLSMDIVIGHGVKLGKQAQFIRESHQCKWVQVVHTVPEELSMLKTYSDCDKPISKGDKKQWDEINLCRIADLVVAVGPKLWEFYSRRLASSERHVFKLTPGIFSELSSLKLSIRDYKQFHVLLFGRGDCEDFELKGYDIAAKAIAALKDTSYHLTFVGTQTENEDQVKEKLLEYGLSKKQLVVKPFLKNREDLASMLSAADLAIIPSRSEGFGLTALEALSAGRPFLVTQTSGFGEALQNVLPQGKPWIVDSEESDEWAEAIKSVRKMGREAAVAECRTLREHYGEKYSWKSQCSDLVEMMVSLANGDKVGPLVTAAPSQSWNEASDKTSENGVEKEQSDSSSKSEQCRELLENGPENLLGVTEGHRPIHEDALQHYFDPVKKGQKFYIRKTATPSPVGASQKEHSPMGATTPSVEQSKEKQDGLEKPLCPTSPLHEDQEEIGKIPSSVAGTRFHSQQAEVGTTNESATQFSNSRKRDLERDLVILAYDVSESSMKDVRKVLQDFKKRLNLSQCPPITHAPSISEVKKQLMNSYPRRCVLVIDADQIIRPRGNQQEKINEYRQLLETAETHVDEKVNILICASSQPSSADVVKDFIKESEKVVPFCLKEGKLSLGVLDLRKIIAPTSVDAIRNPPKGNTINFQQARSFRSAYSEQPQGYHETLSKEWETIGETTPPFNRQQPQGATRNLYSTPTAPINVRSKIIPGWVILKRKLHNGRISRCPESFQVPDDITKNLRQKYSIMSEADIRIIEDDQGGLRYTVEFTSTENPKEGVEIADNETLMLNTLVRFGWVSFEPYDVKYRHNSDWQLPEFILEKVKREYNTAPKVDLFVICDEQGKLRYKAILSAINNAVDKASKFFRKFKHSLH